MQTNPRDLPRQFEMSCQGLTNSAANTKVGLNLQNFMQQSQYSQKLGLARSSRTSTIKGESRKATRMVNLGGLNNQIKNLNHENGGAEHIDFEKSHRSKLQSEKREQYEEQHMPRHSTTGMSGCGVSHDHVQRHTSVMEPVRNDDYDCEEPQVLQHILPENQSPRSQQCRQNNHFTMIIESKDNSRQDVLSQGCNVGKASSFTPAPELQQSSSQQLRRPRSQGAGQRGRKYLSKQISKKAHQMPKARSSVRDGIASFIMKSNIDIDQLSTNLSQKQERNRENQQVVKRVSNINSNNSHRSFSHKSANARSDNSKAPFTSTFKNSSALPNQRNPGLPRPNKQKSQRLAEHYRKESLGRKSKLRYQQMNDSDIMTPEHNNSKQAVPDPEPQPNIILKQQSFQRANNFFGHLTNEDTFQQLQLQASSVHGRQLTMDLLQSQASSKQRRHNHKNSSPNFYHPSNNNRTPIRDEREIEEETDSQERHQFDHYGNQIMNKDHNSMQQHQEANTVMRNKFMGIHDCQDEVQSPEIKDRSGLLVSVNNIHKSPVGTIVKLPAQTHYTSTKGTTGEIETGEYSTFGQMTVLNNRADTHPAEFNLHKINYQSDSQIVFGAETLDDGRSSQNFSRQHSVLSPKSQTRRPGMIVRQSLSSLPQQRTHSSNTSRECGRIVRTINNARNRSQTSRNELRQGGVEDTRPLEAQVNNPYMNINETSMQQNAHSFQMQPEQRPPLHSEQANQKPARRKHRRGGSEASVKSEPEHFQLVFMRSYVPEQREKFPKFQDPLYDNLWDCFKAENLKNVQERLKGKAAAVNQYYEAVKYELQEFSVSPSATYNQNWSDGLLIFMHSQAIVKLLRSATKVLQKERLLLTIQELADVKAKHIEKQQMLKEIRQEVARQTIRDTEAKSSEEDDSDEEREVANLKAGLLQNIINILTQRLVLFSLQLRVYEKEETQIVFEELWEDNYRPYLRQAYFNRFKIFLEQARMEKQRQAAAVDHMNEFKAAQVFRAWREARPKRIAYQTRVHHLTQYVAQRKQRQIFFSLQLNIRLKVAHRLDKRLLKKYQKYRAHHKLFLKWKSRQRQLTEAKEMAIKVLHGHRRLQYRQMVGEAVHFEACNSLMFDEPYQLLQAQRRNNNEKIITILEKIRGFHLGRACRNALEAPLQQRQHAKAGAMAPSPADHTVFSSFIKVQNPNAFSEVGKDSQDAMNMKYDIHALLVDAQNYYQLEKGGAPEEEPQHQAPQFDRGELLRQRQLALIRYDQAKMQKNAESRAPSAKAMDMPKMMEQPELDESQFVSQKAPNQLFERLEKKLQMKNTKSTAPSHSRESYDQVGKAQLEHMMHKIKNEIKAVTKKLAAERIASDQPGTFRRYYSFAVRYLFSRQQTNTVALAHLSFSSQKYNNYVRNSNDQPFRQSMDQIEHQEEYQDSQQDQTMMEDRTGQDQSGFVEGQDDEAYEYEDTERSNERLQRERQQFMQNHEGERYKYIGDGYAGDGQEGLDDVEESFVQSTPDRDPNQQYQVDPSYTNNYQPYQDMHARPSDGLASPLVGGISNMVETHDNHHEQRRGTFTNMHGPSMSLMSKFSLTKDAYTLEDYVQMAQSRQQLPEQLRILMEYIEANNQHIYEDYGESERSCGTSEENDLHTASAPERHIFVILNMAKNMAKLFSEWRVAYLKRRLDNLVESLVSLKSNYQDSYIYQENSKLLRSYLSSWRTLPQHLEQKAQIFSSVHKNVRFFCLFQDWRDASWNLRVLENQRLVKQRKRTLFRGWQSALSDFYEMKNKARSYHNQALCSKALLTMYIHASRMQKMKEFQKKTTFRKFFKRAWKHQYERHKKLGIVMKMMYKKSAEWERTRYQREFDQMVKAIEIWKSKVNERRRLIKNYHALSQYRSTLLIKSFQRWKKLVLVKHGLGRLNNFMVSTCYRPVIERLLEITLSNEMLQRDWLQHRQRYMKQQIIIRLREHIVKKKLAKMFFKRLVLTKLKRYVFSKNKVIPYQFWSRYRQILFFKILRYQVHRRRKRAQKQRACVQQIQGYHQRLLRKCFLALIDHMIKSKKNNIIGCTVTSFRCHQLQKKTFRLLKISYLNRKKNTILKKVAADFRQDRLDGDAAFVNPKSLVKRREAEAQLDSSELRTKNKIVLQKVYTTWLQFTLDNFIKKKVLKRFQSYQEQKIMEKVFKALRQGDVVSSPRSTLEQQAALEDKINEYRTEATFRHSQDAQSFRDVEDARDRGLDPEYIQNLVEGREVEYVDSQSSQMDRYQEQTPCSGFVESSFGGATPLKSSRGQEDRPLVMPVQQSTPAGTLDEDSCQVQDNQQLFQELDDIFKKNQQWMQEQKNKQLHIFGDLPRSQNRDVHTVADLQDSQASAASGLQDSAFDESQLEAIRERQRQLQQRYQQLDADSNNSSLVHTKTETQHESQDSNYLMQAPLNKRQDSQLSLLSSVSSKNLKVPAEKVKPYYAENFNNIMHTSTDAEGVNSSKQVRDLFQPNPAGQSSYNHSGMVDSSAQQHRSNASFGISSFKRKKDQQGSLQILDNIRPSTQGDQLRVRNSLQSHQAHDSNQMDQRYLEQLDSSNAEAGHEKTNSGSANKEGSLLVGGLVLSGSAANLSQEHNEANEDEALIYSNQSSMKNPSSTQNLKSSRPATTTGPTITLKNHPIATVRQDSYQRLSQRSQATKQPDTLRTGTGSKQRDLNISQSTPEEHFRRSKDYEKSKVELLHSSSQVSMTTEQHLQQMRVRTKHASSVAQGLVATPGPNGERDCTKSSVKSLSFSDLAREMNNNTNRFKGLNENDETYY